MLNGEAFAVVGNNWKLMMIVWVQVEVICGQNIFVRLFAFDI